MTTVPEGNDVDVSSEAHPGFDGVRRTGSDAALTTSCEALLPVLFPAGSILIAAKTFPTRSIAKAPLRRPAPHLQQAIRHRLPNRCLQARRAPQRGVITDVHGLVAAAPSPDTGEMR